MSLVSSRPRGLVARRHAAMMGGAGEVGLFEAMLHSASDPHHASGGGTYYLKQERTISNPSAGVSESHRMVRDMREGTEAIGVRRTYGDEYVDKQQVVYVGSGVRSTTVTHHNVPESIEAEWGDWWESHASHHLPPYSKQPLPVRPHPGRRAPAPAPQPRTRPRGGMAVPQGPGRIAAASLASASAASAADRCSEWVRGTAPPVTPSVVSGASLRRSRQADDDGGSSIGPSISMRGSVQRSLRGRRRGSEPGRVWDID